MFWFAWRSPPVEQRCVVSSTWHTSLPGRRQFWTFPRAARVGGLRAQKFVSRNPGTYQPTKIPFFVRFARGVNQLLWAWWQSDVAFIESPQRRICKTWAISGTVSRKMSSNCARCLTQPKPRAGAAEKVQASKIVKGNSYQIWNGPRRAKESSSFQAISFKYTSSRAGVMWPGAFEILKLPRLAQPPLLHHSLPILACWWIWQQKCIHSNRDRQWKRLYLTPPPLFVDAKIV